MPNGRFGTFLCGNAGNVYIGPGTTLASLLTILRRDAQMVVVGWNQTFRRNRKTLISATPAPSDSQARALHGEADLNDAGHLRAFVCDCSHLVVPSISMDVESPVRPRVLAGREPLASLRAPLGSQVLVA